MGQCVSQEPMFPHRQAILAPACNASVSDTSHDNHSHAEFRFAFLFCNLPLFNCYNFLPSLQ